MSTPTPRRDSGMTLVELMVSVAVLGAIVTVLSSALIVTFRQNPETQARLDIARWEQALALWLPDDLASASDVSVVTTDAPCGTADCKFGSNALQLSWDDGSGTTTVSYRYGPAASGDAFVLRRVVCQNGSCTNRVILDDLAAPTNDDGTPLVPAWQAGDPVPDTVIDVTVPLVVDATTPASCDPLNPTPDCDVTSPAQRVIVNVNGSPGNDGVERSSSISYTAGGVSRSTLTPAVYTGPSFLQASSGCGGPITLIVDESNSLSTSGSNSDIAKVKQGIRSLVNTLEGTPTELQLIGFGSTSYTVGAGSSWNQFYDLSDPADITELMGPSGTSGDVNEITGNRGGTNWEDALHRAFYTSTGATYAAAGNPNAPTPELVVFFTDGEPTFDRATTYGGNLLATGSSTPAPASIPTRFDATPTGSSFAPRGWYRADWIVDQFRGDPDIRIVGVGVGSAFNESTTVSKSGWPSSAIPKEVFLGDLSAGGDPSAYGTGSSSFYIKRTYDTATSSWGDVSTADVLVTTQWSQFGGALAAIALDDCGGTLTVQTRDTAGVSADADVTYQVGTEVVTTSRIVKAATFDISLDGVGTDTVRLVPQDLSGTGYTASSWNCRAGGANLTVGSDYSLVTAGTPADGIDVTVAANQAVACTLTVSG